MKEFALICILLSSHLLLAQRKITGTVTDAGTGIPLSVDIRIKTKEGKAITFNSSAAGTYQITVPAGTDTVFYEKTAYRRNWIILETGNQVKQMVDVNIKLIAKDKQTDNAIYQQSEQVHTEIEKSTGKTKGQSFLISAVDAVSGENLEANFTLYSTYLKKKENYQTTVEKNAFEVTFFQKDIVALEVSAQGYETYKGNLMIKTFSARKNNVVKLSRGENVLNLKIAGPYSAPNGRCLLTDATGRKTELMAWGNKNNYSCNVKQTGVASLEIYQTDKIVYSEKLILKKGLNEKIIFLSSDPSLNTALDRVPVSDTVIYFSQSTPVLGQDAKKILTLAAAHLSFNEKVNVRLIGHTDNVGAKNLNMMLSEYRVKTTRQYLTSLGISEKRISCSWKGGSLPAVPNNLEENKQKNRRVELFFENGN